MSFAPFVSFFFLFISLKVNAANALKIIWGTFANSGSLNLAQKVSKNKMVEKAMGYTPWTLKETKTRPSHLCSYAVIGC